MELGPNPIIASPQHELEQNGLLGRRRAAHGLATCGDMWQPSTALGSTAMSGGSVIREGYAMETATNDCGVHVMSAGDEWDDE